MKKILSSFVLVFFYPEKTSCFWNQQKSVSQRELCLGGDYKNTCSGTKFEVRMKLYELLQVFQDVYKPCLWKPVGYDWPVEQDICPRELSNICNNLNALATKLINAILMWKHCNFKLTKFVYFDATQKDRKAILVVVFPLNSAKTVDSCLLFLGDAWGSKSQPNWAVTPATRNLEFWICTTKLRKTDKPDGSNSSVWQTGWCFFPDTLDQRNSLGWDYLVELYPLQPKQAGKADKISVVHFGGKQFFSDLSTCMICWSGPVEPIKHCSNPGTKQRISGSKEEM